jgi:hypothetical protein
MDYKEALSQLARLQHQLKGLQPFNKFDSFTRRQVKSLIAELLQMLLQHRPADCSNSPSCKLSRESALSRTPHDAKEFKDADTKVEECQSKECKFFYYLHYFNESVLWDVSKDLSLNTFHKALLFKKNSPIARVILGELARISPWKLIRSVLPFADLVAKQPDPFDDLYVQHEQLQDSIKRL